MSESTEPSVDTIALRDAERRSVVSASRAYNSSLDGMFYDMGDLTSEEKTELSEYVEPEGSVIIVYPGKAVRRIERLTPAEFVERCDAGRCQVDALAVAGVGSSALGTAALARNVADYLRRPVAGIVSGYGMADLLSEAWGGWFVLGAKNALRDTLARFFDLYQLKDHVRDDKSHAAMKQQFEVAAIDTDQFVYGSPDSATLLYVLSRLGSGIKLVVGHSKGNLSIENALEGLLAAGEKTDAPVPKDLCVVTLGAVTDFPPEFSNVHQFIGTIDYFGMLNSRPFVPRKWMMNDWHSLNSELLGYLPVHEALRMASVR